MKRAMKAVASAQGNLLAGSIPLVMRPEAMTPDTQIVIR